MSQKVVLVAGGTGNVGSFLVRGLLEQGASVIVPSRSEESLVSLRNNLQQSVDNGLLNNLHTVVGNVGEESEAEKVRDEIYEAFGAPDAVAASLGGFVPAPSLIQASTEDLKRVLTGTLLSHFSAARTFLPELAEHGGLYLFINGPLAFEPWKNSQSGLVSTVSAAQHMLFRALSQEFEDLPVTVAELVNYAYVRERKTQPSSPIPGEAVGTFVAHLVLGSAELEHGATIHLKSAKQLDELGISA